MAADGSRRAIIAAFLANAGIAVAKFVGFVITGATSMLAEGIHSVVDSGNQLLLLLGASRGARAATPEHPFGFGRERYFWAFIVALMLFSLGGLFSVYEGVEKLTHPHPLESPGVAIAILVTAILLEAASFVTAMRAASAERGGASWWAYIRNAKKPELPVVLLEDAGALLGLVLALTGIGVAVATGEPRYDAYGTISIGVLLILIAVVLAGEMKSLLIGESASDAQLAEIRDAIGSSKHVRRLIHLKTQHLGPEQLLVAAKIELVSSLDFGGVVDAINATEKRIRERVPIAKLIYLEPDRARETTVPPGSPPVMRTEPAEA